MKYLLDTDHLSIVQRQTGPPFAALSRRVSQHADDGVGLCIVSFHEQILGCHTYINRARRPADVVRGYAMLSQVIRDFSAGPVLHFDSPAAEVFAELSARRLRVATMDLRIAAIALAHGMVLVTRNHRDFAQIPGLNIEDWTGG